MRFMRISNVILAVAGAGLICGMSVAQAQHRAAQKPNARAGAKPQAGAENEGPGGPMGHHPLAKIFAAAMLVENFPRVDSNGDGVISDEERAAAREIVKVQILAMFDANGNGQIDPEERDAIREAVHEKVLQQFDSNGNGRIDPDERAAIREMMHAKMLQAFDANGNGVIDEDERPLPHFEKDGGPGGPGGREGFGPRGGFPGGPEMRQQILEKFDANKNGVLDENERAAAREFFHQKMLERFDTNGNGVIDDNERPNLPGPGTGKPRGPRT